jgi:hypothetical protein
MSARTRPTSTPRPTPPRSGPEAAAVPPPGPAPGPIDPLTVDAGSGEAEPELSGGAGSVGADSEAATDGTAPEGPAEAAVVGMGVGPLVVPGRGVAVGRGVGVGGGGVTIFAKTAVAETSLEPSARMQVETVPAGLQAPDQPVNTEPLEGVALRFSEVAGAKYELHVEGQLIPAGVLVTLPWPWTATVTIGWPSLNPSVTSIDVVPDVFSVNECGAPTGSHVARQYALPGSGVYVRVIVTEPFAYHVCEQVPDVVPATSRQSRPLGLEVMRPDPSPVGWSEIVSAVALR